MEDLAFTCKTGDTGGGIPMPICWCDFYEDGGYHIVEHIDFDDRTEGKCQCGVVHVRHANGKREMKC